MATISLDKQIITYSSQLGIAKDTLLGKIRSLVLHRDRVKSPHRLTIEEYNRLLDEAEARIEAGFFTSHEDVLKEAESW